MGLPPSTSSDHAGDSPPFNPARDEEEGAAFAVRDEAAEAAADATDVRLRHLLHALHDERPIAAWIDRLAS